MARYFIKVFFPDGGKDSGNFGPRAVMAAMEGLMRGSFDKVHPQLKSALYREAVKREPWGGNGLRPDGCLHQHNFAIKNGTSVQIISHMYNNNYGKEFLKNVAFLVSLVDKTRYDFGDEIEEGVFASFFECQQWLYRHKVVEPSSTGRYIASGKLVTTDGGRDCIEKTLKELIKVGRHTKEVLAAQHRYEAVFPDSDKALEGNKHFFVSDLMAHQRRSYMASVRLLSRRTYRPESWPESANPKGYFQGDGYFTVIVTGKEFGSFKREILQVYDWARVPGVTCLYTTNIPEVKTSPSLLKHAYNDADFVGGASNRVIGVAAMKYARPTVPLRAKKSWFFFDDVILCLGSGITLQSKYATGRQVSTTINQILYSGSHAFGGHTWEEHVNINQNSSSKWSTNINSLESIMWVHHDSIGYVPLDHEGDLNIDIAYRPIAFTENIAIFSTWLDHGRTPSQSFYAYAILPSSTLKETKMFALQPKVTILSKTNSLHASCYPSAKQLGAVFYEGGGCVLVNDCFPSEVEKICTNEPSIIVISEISEKKLSKEICPSSIQYFTSKLENKDNKRQNLIDTNGKDKFINTEKTNDPVFNFGQDPSKTTKRENENFLLQIALSDPTQKLSEVTLQLKMKEIMKNVKVSLPLSPKKGESVIECINFVQFEQPNT